MGPSGPSTGLPSPSKSLRPCSVESASCRGMVFGREGESSALEFPAAGLRKEGVRPRSSFHLRRYKCAYTFRQCEHRSSFAGRHSRRKGGVPHKRRSVRRRLQTTEDFRPRQMLENALHSWGAEQPASVTVRTPAAAAIRAVCASFISRSRKIISRHRPKSADALAALSLSGALVCL